LVVSWLEMLCMYEVLATSKTRDIELPSSGWMLASVSLSLKALNRISDGRLGGYDENLPN
jgi:hypothetical protein